MSGRHAAEDRPSRPGLAVAILGLLGLAPPVVILAPQMTAAPVGIERPDLAPADVELTAHARPVSTPAHGPELHVCRCGDRAAVP